jgi:TPR repeat protein
LRKAAREGSLSACFVLGRLYDEGWGVGRNPRVATRWYLRAGEGGLPEALYFVASAYYAGDGITRNQKRAVAWYKKAAAAGDRGADFALAVAALQGNGIRKDEAAGARLLRKLSPVDADALDYLAFHYLQKGRFSLARKGLFALPAAATSSLRDGWPKSRGHVCTAGPIARRDMVDFQRICEAFDEVHLVP